jgi:hypothetical protein
MSKRFSFLFSLALLAGAFWPTISFAHQPNLVKDFSQPVLVKNPEVSKAYYGQLSGKSDEFVIEASDSFNLYVGLSVPDVASARKDFVVTVYRNDQFLFKLQGETSEWKPFYESFGRDNYLAGPEQEMRVEDGTYTIAVDSKDETGGMQGLVEIPIPPSKREEYRNKLQELRNLQQAEQIQRENAALGRRLAEQATQGVVPANNDLLTSANRQPSTANHQPPTINPLIVYLLITIFANHQLTGCCGLKGQVVYMVRMGRSHPKISCFRKESSRR